MIDDVLVAPVHEVVEVLHGRDLEELPGRLDVFDADFAQADVADQSFALHLRDGAELLIPGNLVVDPVQLPQVEALQLQAAQAQQHALTQVFGSAYWAPDVGAVSGQSALGRDHQAARVRRQYLSEQFLAHERPVAVRRVDEADAELRHPGDGATRLVQVFGRTPDSLPGDPHRPETEPIHLEVPANPERAARCRIDRRHGALVATQAATGDQNLRQARDLVPRRQRSTGKAGPARRDIARSIARDRRVVRPEMRPEMRQCSGVQRQGSGAVRVRVRVRVRLPSDGVGDDR